MHGADVRSTAGVRATRLASASPRLHEWEIVARLASGQMASVYLARPLGAAPAASGTYAVKRLDDRFHADAWALKMFRREAALGRRLSHPHLVAVLASHVDAPPYYLVMPYLSGRTLAHLLARKQRPELHEALWYARQASEALDYLAATGLRHGDVKPANFLVNRAGHGTLLDLGSACPVDDPEPAAKRRIVGTVSYLAPELVTSALRADVRSDLYSLGAMLYELLTGQPPFLVRDLAQLAQAQRRERPRALRELAPEVPREVAQLVHELLSKDPWRRPQSPRELIERLVSLEIASWRR